MAPYNVFFFTVKNMLAKDFINSEWYLGTLKLPHRLIQGPLAGYSCAPMRQLFYDFVAPAYSCSEMISAPDILSKHDKNGRYLFRDHKEQRLCYQIAGAKPEILAKAAQKLQEYGADLIDFNCGCPKAKIRKKGSGSALLENSKLLLDCVQALRSVTCCPLTVKIRLLRTGQHLALAKELAHLGIDALIVHARCWDDDYSVRCNAEEIAKIKRIVSIPVIANGDIIDNISLEYYQSISNCDAFMISRAGTGKPWLYQELLEKKSVSITLGRRWQLLLRHLLGLAELENEFKAVQQSKSLVRYYFREWGSAILAQFYRQESFADIEHFACTNLNLEAAATVHENLLTCDKFIFCQE